MTTWLDMGADQFDKRAGTARERRMAARLREQPDTLLPELAEVQLTPRGKAPEAPPRLAGEVPLFEDPCPCKDCRPDPCPPETMRPRNHFECCGQHRRAPWCQQTSMIAGGQ